jgi:8-oxo-dGTP diphosphatase
MTQQHKEYVLGFCFAPRTELRGTDPDPMANHKVVLIRKNKPDWQRGLLNGVGGKIEPGESPDEAMAREWKEETGTIVDDWEPFVVMRFPGATIFVFKRMAHALPDVFTATDEPVSVWVVRDVMRHSGKIPNLNWLIPMALFDAPQDMAKAPNIFYL